MIDEVVQKFVVFVCFNRDQLVLYNFISVVAVGSTASECLDQGVQVAGVT